MNKERFFELLSEKAEFDLHELYFQTVALNLQFKRMNYAHGAKLNADLHYVEIMLNNEMPEEQTFFHHIESNEDLAAEFSSFSCFESISDDRYRFVLCKNFCDEALSNRKITPFYKEKEKPDESTKQLLDRRSANTAAFNYARQKGVETGANDELLIVPPEKKHVIPTVRKILDAKKVPYSFDVDESGYAAIETYPMSDDMIPEVLADKVGDPNWYNI